MVDRKNPVDEWRNIAPMLYDPLMAVVRLAAVNDRAGLSPRGPAPRFTKLLVQALTGEIAQLETIYEWLIALRSRHRPKKQHK